MSDSPTPDPTPAPAVEAGADVSGPEGRPSRRATWLAMGAVAVALGLIWLAPGINDTHVGGGAGGVETDFPGEPDDAQATGKNAPLHFTLKDMNGADVKLASFKGKVILLNFWATWCGPCKAEIPSLVELQHQYGDDLVVLGFSVDDPVEKMRPYAAQYKINYPLLVGLGHDDVMEAYGAQMLIPVTWFINADGTVSHSEAGIHPREWFDAQIRALFE